MKILGVIPARYKSSRFPGKPLVSLLGKPMVTWVCELSVKALGKDNVIVATDDQRIGDAVKESGFRAIMTSDKALTGTDRIWEVSTEIDADIYVNIQGDEPVLNPNDILKVVEYKKMFPNEVINGMSKMKPEEDPWNVNIPKILTTEDGRCVYMSRLPIPGSKSSDNVPKHYWKQVCVHAFNKKELEAFGEFGRKSYMEGFEDIENLRFFEIGISIRMVELSGDTYAVDVPEDVPIVEAALKRAHGID